MGERSKASFNSTLVQLKDKPGNNAGTFPTLFQFYLSSIKSGYCVPANWDLFKFQFYLSSIKSNADVFSLSAITQFQFYLSSIKSRPLKI